MLTHNMAGAFDLRPIETKIPPEELMIKKPFRMQIVGCSGNKIL